MSDAQLLKDCITEYRNSDKKLDEILTKIESDNERTRQEQKAK